MAINQAFENIKNAACSSNDMSSWQLELATLANAAPRNSSTAAALIPATHISALPASMAPTMTGNAVMGPPTMPPPHMTMMPANAEYAPAHHIPISPPLPATAASASMTSNLLMPMGGKPTATIQPTVQPVAREPSWETAISWSDQEEKVS